VTDDLDILLARYFDGSASAEEAERLERQIASDPAVARAMIQVSREELGLRDAWSASRNGDSAGTRDDCVVPAARAAEPVAFHHPALVIGPGEEDRGLLIWWRRNRRAWSIAATLVLAIATVWLVARGSGDRAAELGKNALPPANTAPLARFELSGPGVSLVRNGVKSPADAGTGLAASDQIHTGPSSDAAFRYPGEETHVTLKSSSILAVLSEGGGKSLKLMAGVVDCVVQKQTTGQALIVVTDQAQIRVVGTHFRVTVHGKVTRVEVKTGVVRVTRAFDKATVDVSAGEYVDVGSNASTRPAAGQDWPVSLGRDMAGYWSPQVRPAGINQ
jgi:hypothetical protein